MTSSANTRGLENPKQDRTTEATGFKRIVKLPLLKIKGSKISDRNDNTNNYHYKFT
ncbi:hypothetical protein TUM17564_14330 [Citrobacter freundii]|nr:hypothetical protein CF204P1_26640 [Citrobacter freundii]GJK69406.1 hypothetical protein TUM17564_14330 [Citrobacter freundii]